MIKKAWVFACTVVFTGIFILSLVFYHPLFLSTRIGQFLILVSMLILLWSNLKSLSRIYKLRNCSNQEFLNYLREVQINRINYYKRTLVLGMIFYSSGLLLYLYEIIYKNTFWTVILYAFTIIFLLISWFYIRPKAYQRRKNKFEPLLNHLEKLNNQLQALWKIKNWAGVCKYF